MDRVDVAQAVIREGDRALVVRNEPWYPGGVRRLLGSEVVYYAERT
jgi:hypothetical protein